MKLIVDRIVENIAVLEKEDMSHVEVNCSLLPEGIKEGSVIDYDGTAYRMDYESEQTARARIINKQKSIFKKHK